MDLKFVIDTGTWMKMDALREDKIINQKFIETLYQCAEIKITHEIEDELKYHEVLSYDKMKTHITPVQNQLGFERALKDGYDRADASILGIKLIEEYIILTEDRPLYDYCEMYNLNVLFFADFIWLILTFGWISKNRAYKILHPLQSLKNISKFRYKHLIKKIKEY